MIRWKKIEAGAIQYVLVVSVIIIIILFAFISLVYLQTKVRLKSELHKETIQNVYQAFDYLSQKKVFPYQEQTTLKFTDFDKEETQLIKKRWGLFDLAIATSKINNERFQKTAIIGNHQINRKALYLQENNQPLVVVGTTKITGNVILPKRGVKTGSIAGTSYYGEKLIYGNINTNANRLPTIENLEYITQLSKGLPFQDYESLNLEDGVEMHQTFEKKTLLFETLNELRLNNMSLEGNIVLISSSKIRVFPSAKLNHVILIAPEVVFESGFIGNCQVFASKNITIKDNVKLSYPSGLTVIDQSQNNNDSEEKIRISKGADVRGVVVYHSTNKVNNYNTQIFVEPNAKVTGEIYCNKNLELGGSVDGFVYTNNFIARQYGGTYINHIYNGQINVEAIPEEYNGLFVGELKPKIAAWVD